MNNPAEIIVTETISITTLRRRFGHYLSRVEKGDAFIITRYKKPIAALLPYSRFSAIRGSGDVALATDEIMAMTRGED